MSNGPKSTALQSKILQRIQNFKEDLLKADIVHPLSILSMERIMEADIVLIYSPRRQEATRSTLFAMTPASCF